MKLEDEFMTVSFNLEIHNSFKLLFSLFYKLQFTNFHAETEASTELEPSKTVVLRTVMSGSIIVVVDFVVVKASIIIPDPSEIIILIKRQIW